MRFRCPHCGKGLNAKDQFAGRKVACPLCKRMITLPVPGTVRGPVDVEQQPPARGAASPHEADPGSRRRLHVALAVAAVLGLMAASATVAWHLKSDSPEGRAAERPSVPARDELSVAAEAVQSPTSREPVSGAGEPPRIPEQAASAPKQSGAPVPSVAQVPDTEAPSEPWTPRLSPEAENHVVVTNQSAMPVLARLTGPCRQEVNLAAGASGHLVVSEGNYRVTARYGTPGSYTYTEGPLFKVMLHRYARDAKVTTSVALPAVPVSDGEWQSIDERRFATMRTERRSSLSQIYSDRLIEEVLLKQKALVPGDSQSAVGFVMEEMARLGEIYQNANRITDRAERLATVRRLIAIAETRAGGTKSSDREVCQNALYALNCFKDLRAEVLPVLQAYARHGDQRIAKCARDLLGEGEKAGAGEQTVRKPAPESHREAPAPVADSSRSEPPTQDSPSMEKATELLAQVRDILKSVTDRASAVQAKRKILGLQQEIESLQALGQQEITDPRLEQEYAERAQRVLFEIEQEMQRLSEHPEIVEVLQ